MDGSRTEQGTGREEGPTPECVGFHNKADVIEP